MAVDIVCIEETTSPRISFSYDINKETKFNESSSQPDDNNNNSDFYFPELTGEEYLSPADELFFQGKIKPLIQLNQNFTTTHKIPNKSDTLRTLMEESPNRVDSSPVKPPLKFLWTGVRRSSSLNCENIDKKTSSFWSLSLLSRSKSTGSPVQKQKPPKPERRSKSPSSSFSMYSFAQKSPSMKKDYGNGVRVNPVLNLPPNPSRGSLSLCSLFGNSINGKDMKKKK